MNKNVVAVCVTFNRLDKLKNTINAFDSQTVPITELVVVDNASTDSTKEFLSTWVKQIGKYRKKVITLDKNYGGSGGFYAGMEYAGTVVDCDWVYLGDDDAYLDKNGIELFQSFEKLDDPKTGLVAGKVLMRGNTAYAARSNFNRSFIHMQKVPNTESDYQKPYFEIDSYTFVGIFIKKELMLKCGLPEKDYFIWYDDTEYSLRTYEKKSGYKSYLVPSIVIDHDYEYTPHLKYIWKDYYGFRNHLYLLKKHLPYRYYLAKKIQLKLSARKDKKNGNGVYKLKLDAIKDVKKGKKGISEVYYPGRIFEQ